MIEFIVRDFVVSWFSTAVSGGGDSNFIQSCKNQLALGIGELFRRIMAVNVTLFLICDVTEEFRRHLQYY